MKCRLLIIVKGEGGDGPYYESTTKDGEHDRRYHVNDAVLHVLFD